MTNLPYQVRSVFIYFDRVYNFTDFRLFDRETDWGSKNDWLSYINPSSPKASTAQRFLDCLIDLKIIIPNYDAKYNGSIVIKYKLTIEYKKLILERFLENTEEFRFISKYFSIYSK